MNQGDLLCTDQGGYNLIDIKYSKYVLSETTFRAKNGLYTQCVIICSLYFHIFQSLKNRDNTSIEIFTKTYFSKYFRAFLGTEKIHIFLNISKFYQFSPIEVSKASRKKSCFHFATPSIGTLQITSHCLKITKNVAFQFLKFWHFPPFLSY